MKIPKSFSVSLREPSQSDERAQRTIMGARLPRSTKTKGQKATGRIYCPRDNVDSSSTGDSVAFRNIYQNAARALGVRAPRTKKANKTFSEDSGVSLQATATQTRKVAELLAMVQTSIEVPECPVWPCFHLTVATPEYIPSGAFVPGSLRATKYCY